MVGSPGRGHRGNRAPLRLPSPALLLYFACLGVAFMLVEIPLTQKFVLFLGHPTYAFTVILSSMLTFSGIGSLLSSRIRVRERPRLLAAWLGVLVAVLLATLLSVGPLMHGLLGWPLPARLVVTVVFLAPVALLMGVRSRAGSAFWATANLARCPGPGQSMAPSRCSRRCSRSWWRSTSGCAPR